MLDPSNNIGVDKWGIVNDGVMGGISQSNIYLNEVDNIIFAGNVSLENNGGFASIRSCLLYTSPSPRDRVLSRMPSSA